MVIVALFTTDAGAAVFTLAMYSGSVFGISSLGKADADVISATETTQNPTHARAWSLFMAYLLKRACPLPMHGHD
jgi:hypothetical protein